MPNSKKIKEEGLPYERENKMEKILKRGKVKNDIEYNYVMDTITPLQQERILSPDNIKMLNKILDNYEKS